MSLCLTPRADSVTAWRIATLLLLLLLVLLLELLLLKLLLLLELLELLLELLKLLKLLKLQLLLCCELGWWEAKLTPVDAAPYPRSVRPPALRWVGASGAGMWSQPEHRLYRSAARIGGEASALGS